MKLVLHLVLLSVYISFTYSSLYSNVKDNVVLFVKRTLAHPEKDKTMLDYKKEKKKDLLDFETAHSKSKVLKKMKNVDKISHDSKGVKLKQKDNTKFVKDPVLNVVGGGRRALRNHKIPLSDSESSSLEMDNWKDEWREHWLQKKFEAINSTEPRGDTVNMVGARPWGVPCGDPNQHDMPWGTCMLPMECESEFRIYRGDYFCGRTQFICCGLQVTTYDMYQAFDASFADSDLETDSEEKRNRDKGSKERQRRKKIKAMKKRRRERQRRKRKIKRNIKKIVKEIRKILSRTYRNGTAQRKKKTKQLKKFIEFLKKQYKKDRHSVKTIHMQEIQKIDVALQTKLKQIKGLNRDFIKNSTFRDIIVNGTIKPSVARELLKAYPELSSMLDTRRSNPQYGKPTDYLNYDIEYGLLYY